MKYVIDTSSLISLARIQNIELIEELEMTPVAPDEVYEEAVIQGHAKGYADSLVIADFIKKYDIKILSVEDKYKKDVREKTNKILTSGDEAVLALATREKIRTVITNDDGLGRIALATGFVVRATPDLLLEGLRKKILNHDKYESFVRGLVIENRLSSAIAELYLLEGKKHVKS